MLSTLMKTRHRLLAAAAMAAVGVGASAHAGSVSLVGDAGLVDSLTFDLGDGLSMTLTGTTFKAKAYQDAQVGQTADGIGITHSLNNDSFQIDGKGGDDTLWITFSDEVTLTGFDFNFTNDASDDAKLIDVDDNTLLKFDVVDSVSFADAYTGTTFGLKAFGTRDDWTVTELSYLYDAPLSDSPIEALSVTALPTPSAALAGAVTLGVLTLRRRRQNAEQG
ncbi:MAG: hypothetical protein AAF797_12355 [Planctomycetota bacterium]